MADGKIEVLKETEEIDTDASHVDILSYKDGQLLYYKGEEVCLYRTDTKQNVNCLTDVTKSRWCLGTDEKQENIYYSEENEEYSEVYQLNLQTKEKTSIVKKEKNGKELVWNYWAENFIMHCLIRKNHLWTENWEYMMQKRKRKEKFLRRNICTVRSMWQGTRMFL